MHFRNFIALYGTCGNRAALRVSGFRSKPCSIQSWRIVSAAKTAGIALTLLPVFYAHGNFGGAATAPLQRRFVHSTYTFERLLDRLARKAHEEGYVLGIAPHSLRAVTPEEFEKILRLATPRTAPVCAITCTCRISPTATCAR